jgi:hypothetical protein
MRACLTRSAIAEGAPLSPVGGALSFAVRYARGQASPSRTSQLLKVPLSPGGFLFLDHARLLHIRAL